MIKEGKFGIQEAICLITITISTKVFFTSPAYLTRFVGTAAWYTTIVSAVVAFIGFMFLYVLLKRFPGKNIVEIFDIVLGRYLGLIFSFILSVFFMFIAAMLLREFTEVIKVFALPLSPPSFIIGLCLIVIVTLCYLGLETIARFSKFVAYILLVSFVSVLVLSWQNYDLRYIFPIMGYGLDNTLIHGIRRSSAYGEVIVLAVIASSLQGVRNIKKAGIISLILSTIIISSAIFAFTISFPYYNISELTAPIYQMVRWISYGGFLQRLDPIYMFTWNISTIIAVTILFYCSVSIFCKAFRLQDIRPVLFPMALIFFSFAMLPNDFNSIVSGYIHRFREYGWIVFFGVPLLVLIFSLLRKKKGAKANA